CGAFGHGQLRVEAAHAHGRAGDQDDLAFDAAHADSPVWSGDYAGWSSAWWISTTHCDANSMVRPRASFCAPIRSRPGMAFFGIGMWSVSRKQGRSPKACVAIGAPRG